jgi:hypothetical protein
VIFFGVGGALAFHFSKSSEPKTPVAAPVVPPPSLLGTQVVPPVAATPAHPVVEPPVTPPPEPVVAADHRARLRVSCAAQQCGVVIDGQFAETAPSEVKVKPGKHLVQVQIADETTPRGHRSVDVGPDELVVMHFGAHGESGRGSSFAAGKMMDADACRGATACELRHLREALALSGENPTIHRRMGLALAREGNAGPAIFHLENYLLLQKKPARDEAEIKAKIAELKHLQ